MRVPAANWANYERSRGLVRRCAHRLCGGRDAAIVGAGEDALLEAAIRWRPSRGEWDRWALACVYGAMRNALTARNRARAPQKRHRQEALAEARLWQSGGPRNEIPTIPWHAVQQTDQRLLRLLYGFDGQPQRPRHVARAVGIKWTEVIPRRDAALAAMRAAMERP